MIHASIDTADSAPTGEALGGVREGRLYFQRCRWCRTAVFRRLLCPVCASTDLDLEPSRGLGAVQQVIAMGRGVGTRRASAVIGMNEGFSLRCEVVGTSPLTVHVGAMVRLATGTGSDAQDILFRLCDSAEAVDDRPMWTAW